MPFLKKIGVFCVECFLIGVLVLREKNTNKEGTQKWVRDFGLRAYA